MNKDRLAGIGKPDKTDRNTLHSAFRDNTNSLFARWLHLLIVTF